MDKPYDNWGFEEQESFQPLALQCKTTFTKDKTKNIKYTQIDSFLSEEGLKKDDLLIPQCDKK